MTEIIVVFIPAQNALKFRFKRALNIENLKKNFTGKPHRHVLSYLLENSVDSDKNLVYICHKVTNIKQQLHQNLQKCTKPTTWT